MNLRELPTPVRLYWDLPQHLSSGVEPRKICDQMLELKILFLSLYDASSPPTDACLDILDRLQGKHIAVSLTVALSALELALLNWLEVVGVKTLLVEAASPDEVKLAIEKLQEAEGSSLKQGISFHVTRGNFRDIPEVISLCLEHDIAVLSFPIQRLTGDGDCFCLSKDEAAELGRLVHGSGYRKLQITIHDPFLWQVFYPEADYHEGGCQAANSMLYISPDFRVYPCPAMPLELGDLRETSLADIIHSEKKQNLRDQLLRPPADCGACDLSEKCLGGCRGRSLVSSGTLDSPDPGCLIR